MLRFVHKRFPDSTLSKGDIILTGTPGGVILNVPRWKARLAKLLGLDRFQKLAINQREKSAVQYLKARNEIHVTAQWLGSINVTIVEP
jgi:2-keto-4-pentenoate hydratase/2-oxohepta-3-ene-1,7-dioic acid hydratase in catechol pathway